MSKPSKGVPRDLPKEGDHHGVCKIVADLGVQESANKDYKPRRVILFIWELPKLSKPDAPVYVRKDYTFTTRSKGLLMLCKTWLKRKDTDMDFADCVGMGATITVEHNDSGEYANVGMVLPGKSKPSGVMKELSVFLDDSFDQDDFDKLPQWVQDKAMDSDEYAKVAEPKKKGKSRNDEDEEESPRTKRNRAAREEKPAKKKARRG